ncbi:unnamed protein product [Phytomonas sp. EM1]|nr:unnamed protein product [Phytomonas sp. EM1]|eukprot:CCW62086.1 unnamed protein product [Phytomonas sp. isolate EM1]
MHRSVKVEGSPGPKAFSRGVPLHAEDETTTKMAQSSSNNNYSKNDIEPPPQLPVKHRNYYCCRNCRRILAESQWYAEGCSECGTGPIRRDELLEYASSHFHNFFGLIAPEKSWVARLIGKKRCLNGVFAEAISDEDLGDDKEDAEMDNVSEHEPERDRLLSVGAHVAEETSLNNSELWRD